jgi:hypothetical protein
MDEAESTDHQEGGKALATEWAAKKGMADRFLDTSSAFPVANPKFQEFAQARAFAGWAWDTVVTEAEFDAAVAAAQQTAFR